MSVEGWFNLFFVIISRKKYTESLEHGLRTPFLEKLHAPVVVLSNTKENKDTKPSLSKLCYLRNGVVEKDVRDF